MAVDFECVCVSVVNLFLSFIHLSGGGRGGHFFFFFFYFRQEKRRISSSISLNCFGFAAASPFVVSTFLFLVVVPKAKDFFCRIFFLKQFVKERESSIERESINVRQLCSLSPLGSWGKNGKDGIVQS